MPADGVRTAVRLWIAGVAAALGYRFFHFIGLNSVNILFWDQWDFFTSFFPGGHPTLAKLFLWQHGPPRLGLGLVIDRFLYTASGWNVRVEAFVIGACIFGAMLLALLLKRKLFRRLTWTDAAIPFIFLTLVQWDTMVGTPNLGYGALPLLLILLYCLVLIHPQDGLRYPLLLGINFLLIYTGFGLFMGIVTIAVFALECYWRLRGSISTPIWRPFVALLVACAEQASFFVNYTFAPAADCFTFPHPPFKPYLVFFNVMFANYSGIWVPDAAGWKLPDTVMSLAGTAPAFILGVVFLIQIYKLLKPEADYRPALVIGVLTGYSMLFALNTAVGRLCLGQGGAFTARYATLLIPAFLGLYLFAAGLRAPVAIRILAMCLAAGLVVPGSLVTPPGYLYYVNGKRAWAACYLQKESIAECDSETHFQVYPGAERTHLRQKLKFMKENRLSLFAGQ